MRLPVVGIAPQLIERPRRPPAWGVEPGYVFSFRVGRFNSDDVKPAEVERVTPVRDWGRLEWLWRRIWSADA